MSNPALTPLQCIQCKTPIPAQPDEIAWVCGSCKQAMQLDDKQPSGLAPLTVLYDSKIQSGQRGRPFWVARGDVSISRQAFRGNADNEARSYWSQPRTFFVPAYSSSMEDMVAMGMNLMNNPVNPTWGQPAPFLPVTLAQRDVRSMAEFIVMGIETSRKDMLKTVHFQLKLDLPELWVLV